MGLVLHVVVAHTDELYSIEVHVPSKLNLGQCSKVVISRGLVKYVKDILENDNMDLDTVLASSLR